MGTEIEPDWFVHGGNYAPGATAEQRLKDDPQATLAPPQPDERRRSIAAAAQTPARRFHYRYIAADLAWSAAGLLPDESDFTASVLNEAGSWLKDRDPKAADRFYKALVGRCRTTALGKAAEERRWFAPS